MTPNSPLPPTSLPFLQQEYLQAALQDNGALLPAVESPVALTNVVSTEQGTLCSCIRVKYLLFISAKARKRRKGKKEGSKGRSQSDQDRRRRGEVSWRLWRHWDNPWQPSAGILNNLALYSYREYRMSSSELHGEMVGLGHDRFYYFPICLEDEETPNSKLYIANLVLQETRRLLKRLATLNNSTGKESVDVNTTPNGIYTVECRK